jgi:divalent metal cation (Fe/Co/Zn/Cd) transporter
MTELSVIRVVQPRVSADRARLQRRARRLAWLGNLWHVIEFAIALGAGIVAGSIALVAFGMDSLIELAAGTIIVWLFTGSRLHSETAERRAQHVIAASFFVLAAYVAAESMLALTSSDHPSASWVGIGLAVITAPTMPLLARAKRRVGRELGSYATQSEGQQNMICAYLSIALLVGLCANALLGWWWADPLAALVIAAAAVSEGIESWRGKGCADGCC